MTPVEQSIREHGLIPHRKALPAIRAVLAEEARRESAGEPREIDLAYLCCVQLFAAGLVEDCRPIWAAKRSGFDLGCVIDGELLCGAGVAETMDWLATKDEDWAQQIRTYLAECDFPHFEPLEQLDHYRAYFGEWDDG